MIEVALIVRANHFLTMEGEGTGYRHDAAMAIDQGRIVAVAPAHEIARTYIADKTIDAGENLVMPGFVDAHMHLQLTLLRGLAQDVRNWMMDGLALYRPQPGLFRAWQ